MAGLFRLGRALAAAGLLLLVSIAGASAACIEKGGFPFESGIDSCLPGDALTHALSFSRGPTPPHNNDGQGAPQGYWWDDTSVSPETLRVCNISQCGTSYVAGQWGIVGTFGANGLTTLNSAQILAALGGTPVLAGNNGSDFGNAATVRSNIGLGALIAPLTISGNTGKLGTVSGSLVNGHCLEADGNGNIVDFGAACGSGGGGGSVSSVGASGGGIFSFSGGPITSAGTLALGVSGTSGGIPYFSSGSALSASPALTANALLTGGGPGQPPNAVAVSGLVLGNGGSAPSGYGGANCTNQALIALSGAGSASCASITNAYLAAGSFANISGVGTLISGATGAGFTINFGASTIAGQLGSSALAASLNLVTPNIGAATGTSLAVGGGTEQSDAPLSARRTGNGLEFGHNASGFLATLGGEPGGGQPFICFGCAADGSNTFKTFGNYGLMVRANLSSSSAAASSIDFGSLNAASGTGLSDNVFLSIYGNGSIVYNGLLSGNNNVQPHVADNATLAASTIGAYPNGVRRDDFAAGNGAPPMDFKKQTGTCAGAGMPNDGARCQNEASGNSFVGIFTDVTADIREWGATSSADIMPYLKTAWQANIGMRIKIPAAKWPVRSAQLFALGGAPGGLPMPCFYGDAPQWHGDSSAPPVTEYMTGTWLHWEGAYDSIGSPFQITGTQPAVNTYGDTSYFTGCGFENLGFYEDQPTPGPGWAPDRKYSYWFDLYNFNHIKFDGIFDLNNTHLITSSIVGRLEIGRIDGQPLGMQLNITQAYDMPKWGYIHDWPFWSVNPNVLAYTRANVSAIATTSAIYADTIFDIAYHTGFYSTTQAGFTGGVANFTGNVMNVTSLPGGAVVQPGEYITGPSVPAGEMVVDYDGATGGLGQYYVSVAVPSPIGGAAINGVASDFPLGGHINHLYVDESCRGFFNDADNATWHFGAFQHDGYNPGAATWDTNCPAVKNAGALARLSFDEWYEDQAASQLYQDAGHGGVNGGFLAVGTLRFSDNGVVWGMDNSGVPAFDIANESGAFGVIQVANFLQAGATGCTSTTSPGNCTGSNPNYWVNTSTNGIYDISGLWIPFTPAFAFLSGGSVGYADQYGEYSQDVNGVLTGVMWMALNSVSSPAGTTTIIGAPWTCSGSNFRSGGSGNIPYTTGMTGLTGTPFLSTPLGGAGSAINFYQSGASGSVSAVVSGSNLTSSTYLRGMIQCIALP